LEVRSPEYQIAQRAAAVVQTGPWSTSARTSPRTEINALLPYKVWIRHGMPAKWEGSQAWWSVHSPAGKYAEIPSPDGAFRVVVLRRASWGGVAAGQGGDVPGYALLLDGKDTELRREAVGSVNQVKPIWEEGTVRLSPLVRWQLDDDAW